MIGSQLGPYKLLRLLGSGGMGTVYLGEHAVLGRMAAIKVLDPRLMQHKSIVTRFVNEGRAAARLVHPNLIPVYDIAQAPNDGPWYMALEFLEGVTLGHYLASHPGPVAPSMIVRFLAPTASCMRHVHTLGAIHRDLKPDNLFLIRRGTNPFFVVVLDLGVAQLSEDLARSPGTKNGTIIGTPVYMAPEQLLGQRVSPAADVYAMGVIAYEMATGGWFPFQRDDETRVQYINLVESEISFRQRSAPIDPRKHNPGLPAPFVDALMRALERDLAARPASAASWALSLGHATRADRGEPDGIEIIREVAEDLLPPVTKVERRSTPPQEIASTSNADARYQILEKLGAGGMAEVFLARQAGEAGFERRVAIKRVLAGLSELKSFAAMFVSEARLASRLTHENIVAVSDFSKDAEGRLFLVMEYVHGRDLSALLDAGPLAPSLIIYIVTCILRGLGYAHDLPDPTGTTRGLVHRDVSPQNVLLSYEGGVKVSDFGLAKAMTASGKARSESVRGKVSYMSPEQCNGEALDARSDLFAVGVLLHEMLTHRPLFVGTPSECIAWILFRPIPPPHTIFSRVPPDLEKIAMRLLERDRNDRYATADEAINDLLACTDAPRDGSGELAHVLAERFPDASIRQRSSGAGATGGTPRALMAQQMAVAAPISTLGGAASQSLPSRAKSRALVGVSAIVAIAAASALFVFLRQHHGAATSRDAAVPLVDHTSDASLIASVAFDAGSSSVRNIVIDASEAANTVDAGIDASAQVASHVAHAVDAGVHHHTNSAVHPSVTADANDVAAASVAPQGTGELAIFIHPFWAEVWLNGVDVGQTPYRNKKAAAGRYKLHLVNDDVGKKEPEVITVTAGQTTTIERTW